jgi:hypothetical protein
VPALILGIPAAIVLAWVALKGRLPRRDDVRSFTGGFAGEPLAAGETGEMRQEEDPWKRHELPTDRPDASGGEIGGPYGPGTQEQSPSGGGTVTSGATSAGSIRGPGPDTTFYGAEIKGAGVDTTYYGGAVRQAIAPTPTYTPTQLAAAGVIAPKPSAPAPTPTTPTVTYSLGKAVAI